MTRKDKLLRRVLPLWAGAAALFLAPHACRGFAPATTRWGLVVPLLALLLPLSWALWYLTAMRTWRGLVAAAATFAGIGAAFFLSARAVGLQQAAELPFLAAAAWLVVAVRAARDPEWRWADAARSLVPGGPTVGFLAWAAVAAGAWWAAEYASFGSLLLPRAGDAAWAVILVACLGGLFQIGFRASRSFTARCALSLVAAAHALGATRGYGGGFTVLTFTEGTVADAIADLTVLGLFVWLLQDELARRLPRGRFLARQRAYANWRVLAAAGVAAAFVIALATWASAQWSMPPARSIVLVAAAAPVAFAVFVHLALAARLPVPLAAKLAVSGLALFAAMDLVFFVAPDLPRFLEMGYPSDFISRFKALRNGLTAFGVTGWSALCSVAHLEYRAMPLAGERIPFEDTAAAVESEGAAPTSPGPACG